MGVDAHPWKLVGVVEHLFEALFAEGEMKASVPIVVVLSE